MRTEQELRDAIRQLIIQDNNCPVTAHKEGRTCFDVGHAIRGTWRHVLRWVLEEADTPWYQP